MRESSAVFDLVAALRDSHLREWSDLKSDRLFRDGVIYKLGELGTDEAVDALTGVFEGVRKRFRDGSYLIRLLLGMR